MTFWWQFWPASVSTDSPARGCRTMMMSSGGSCCAWSWEQWANSWVWLGENRLHSRHINTEPAREVGRREVSRDGKQRETSTNHQVEKRLLPATLLIIIYIIYSSPPFKWALWAYANVCVCVWLFKYDLSCPKEKIISNCFSYKIIIISKQIKILQQTKEEGKVLS